MKLKLSVVVAVVSLAIIAIRAGTVNSNSVTLNVPCSGAGCGGGGTTIFVTQAPYNAKCDGVTNDDGAFQSAESFAESHATAANPYTIMLPTLPANCFLGGSNSSGDGSAGIVMRGNYVTLSGATTSGGAPNSEITFTGSACIPGVACSAVSFGQWSTTWRNGSPSYNITDTHYGDTTLTLAFAEGSAFASGCTQPGCVGDLVTFFQEYPDGGPAGSAFSPDFGGFTGHCHNCDTIPMQTEKITAFNSSTGVMTLAGPVYVGFTNNRYTAPGQGICQQGPNSPAGSNCLAVCAPSGGACTGGNNYPYLSQPACSSDVATYGSAVCTPGYPAQGNKVVAAINTNNHAAQNIGVQNIIFNTPNWPMLMSQDFNGRITNLIITGQQYCNLQTTNTETKLIINNTNWQSGAPGTFCQGRSSEGFQRESSMSWINSTFGDSTYLWSAGFGSVEPPYNFTWSGNTMFLGVTSGNNVCDMEFGAAGLNFSGNTISTFQPCTLPANSPYAFMISDTINTGCVVNSPNCAPWYTNHQVFNNNTFNCQGSPGACLNILSSDTQVTNNRFNMSGSGLVVSVQLGNQSNPIYSATWNISGNTFNGMASGNTGIVVPGGYNPDNFHIDNNTFNGTGGTSISVYNNATGTTTGCSIHNNTVSGGVSAPSVVDHGFCTFP